MKLLVCLALLTLAYGVTAQTRPTTATLAVRNGGQWGDWGVQQFCPVGTFATGYRQKVERPCGALCDDTAMNGIELRCSLPGSADHAGTITSRVGPWGEWFPWLDCTYSDQNRFWLTRFRLDVEPPGSADNTAANNVNMECRHMNASQPVYELHGNSPAPWGTSREWSNDCPLGSAICGVQTKVEPPQGLGDDTALNDIRMFCCNYNAF